MLSRDAILGFKDTRIGKVDVPEMGGEVCVANLTVAEIDRFRKNSDDTPAGVLLVVLAVCDEQGNRLFTDKDRDALAKLPASAIGVMANAVLEHNGLGATSNEDAKNG